MKALECTTGDKFGYWEVIDNTPISIGGHTYVKVMCRCGKRQTNCLSDLVHGRATGCRNCKARDRKRPINIGDIFKNWVVIEGYKISKSGNVVWKVQCTRCGISTRWIQGNELMNPTHCFCCQKCASKDRADILTALRGRVGDLKQTQYARLKHLAKIRDIEFSISLEFLWDLYLSQNKRCALTGTPLGNIKDASLDRINSSLGYTSGNVQWTTKQINISKHILSTSDFVALCQQVVNHANQQPS